MLWVKTYTQNVCLRQTGMYFAWGFVRNLRDCIKYNLMRILNFFEENEWKQCLPVQFLLELRSKYNIPEDRTRNRKMPDSVSVELNPWFNIAVPASIHLSKNLDTMLSGYLGTCFISRNPLHVITLSELTEPKYYMNRCDLQSSVCVCVYVHKATK